MSEQIREKDRERLKKIAVKVIEPENAFTREEIVKKIMEKTGVNQERAEKGFSMMLESGAIEVAGSGKFFLGGSTPF